MPTVTVAPLDDEVPAYDVERALQILRNAHPGPAPVAPAPGFLDRLGAGLANLQAGPAGRGGDAFGANLIAGFGQSFGGGRVAARDAALKAQMDEYERKKAMAATEGHVRLKALDTDYQTRGEKAKEAARNMAAWRKEKRDYEKAEEDRKIAERKEARRVFESDRDFNARKREGSGRMIAIETPEGPRYVREGEAVGKTPAKGSREGNRPPASAEREHLTGDIDLLRQINDVRAAYKPEFVGPYAGGVRGAVTSRIGGQSQAEAKFRGRVSAIRNQILKLRSGGAVTDGEAQRLLEELMVVNDPSGSFESKMDNFEDLVRNMATTRREVFQGTGIDLSRIPSLPPSMRASAAPKSGGFFESNAPGR